MTVPKHTFCCIFSTQRTLNQINCISATIVQNTKQRENLAAYVLQFWQDYKQKKQTRWDIHAGSHTPEGQHNRTAKHHARNAQKNCRLCISLRKFAQITVTHADCSKFMQENMCTYETTNCWGSNRKCVPGNDWRDSAISGFLFRPRPQDQSLYPHVKKQNLDKFTALAWTR